MDIRKFREQDRKAVISLWRRCGLLVPWNHPDLDIDRKLEVQSELFLVGEIDGEVVLARSARFSLAPFPLRICGPGGLDV